MVPTYLILIALLIVYIIFTNIIKIYYSIYFHYIDNTAIQYHE